MVEALYLQNLERFLFIFTFPISSTINRDSINIHLICYPGMIIIYQKLFKKICPKCNNKKNEGCSYCNYTGTKGRIAVGEVLKVDDNLRKSILNDNYIDLIDEYIK